MAYTIFNTRNNELAVVEDGTIEATARFKMKTLYTCLRTLQVLINLQDQ
jgi:hypothetical protein